MPLASGTTLGPYQIEAPVGAGGMGEVYRARDTRLDRTVAIKVLPEHVAADPDLKQRFEREAKTISNLNHPHICTLHDIGTQDGIDFLVMEYLDGETLAQRLEKGALPLDQALTIAIEIADALNKSHRQGIVHRDLKPGNIMLTKAGAKLLDFGLAKLKATGTVGATEFSAATTQSEPLTERGTILGTLHYMSPEQVEGKEVDARADVFAFGAVLYEMVTGERAFAGDTQASVMGAILKDDPRPVSALQPTSPPMLDRVVKKCLAKDPYGRWQTVHDLHDELTWIAQGDAQVGASASTAATGGQPKGLTAIGWRVAGVVATALGLAAAVWVLRPSPQPVNAARVIVSLSPADSLVGPVRNGVSQVTVSRDGTTLAYVGVRDGERELYIRELAVDDARAVPDSTDANLPFFSPDGEWVGFFAAGFLKKVSVGGGTPITLAEAPAPRGGSWNENGMIVFASPSRAALSRVSADGGTPETVTVLDAEHGETSHRQPRFLPGGRAIVFFAETTGREGRIVVQSLETGERRDLMEGATRPRYSPTGHLLYVQGGTNMAAPFDLERLELAGAGVPILPDEATLLDVSDTGTLADLATEASRRSSRLVWVTRTGQEEPLAVPPRNYRHPRLSPDGRRVAVDIEEAGDRNIWLYDISREGLTKLTSGGDNLWPVWTPNGSHISYASNSPQRGWDVHQTRADSAGTDEVLWASELPESAKSWSPDGQTLAVTQTDPLTLQDILLFTPEGLATRPWLQTAAVEIEPAIAPNGQWVAYVSRERESGPLEVYVRPPAGSWRRQVSTNGGVKPVWSRDGRELFYWNGSQLHGVSVMSGDMFQHETPAELFEGLYFRTTTAHASYDVASDGRFLMVKPEEQVSVSQINVVLNWFQELTERVPTN